MDSPLTVRDLDVRIHGTPVLDSVSFDIEPGEIFGLVGESGSGKTMTSLAMMGLLPSGSETQGSVGLDSMDLMKLDERELCSVRGEQIGMIFQEPMTALNPVQTIGDQVAETLRVHGKANRAEALRVARERLDRVGLPEARFPLGIYPHQLSGGQRQRVCIALAIALRPRLLIADEPTTALDVSTQARILDLLRSLVEDDGMSLMLITHDLAVVAGLASRVAVMQKGKIVEMAETPTLFGQTRHRYTRQLLSASHHVPARAKAAIGPAEPDVLLEVRDAVREYSLGRPGLFARPPVRRAVDKVSFDLHTGESLGLVGESGCGKSTLVRAILGLEPLQDGQIHLRGRQITARRDLPLSLRRQMQVVFQDPFGSFNPRHTVRRLVSEPFHLDERQREMSECTERVAEALESVGLDPGAMNRYIHEFSGGQRQRIAIARALVIRPKLIILDEAVSSLDVSIRAQVLDLLAELQAQHELSYLFISHDLTVIRAITDRVLVMQTGRIVESGATDEVLASPVHAYTQQLIEAAPSIPKEWRKDSLNA